MKGFVEFRGELKTSFDFARALYVFYSINLPRKEEPAMYFGAKTKFSGSGTYHTSKLSWTTLQWRIGEDKDELEQTKRRWLYKVPAHRAYFVFTRL